jgi:hypothetical protein
VIDADDISARLRDYTLFRGYEQVAGWLDPGALSMLLYLSKLQGLAQVTGAVAEIGVHHGKLFVMLCLLRNEGESAVGIDIFEDQHLNVDQSGRGSRADLEAHLARFVGEDPRIKIAKADSLLVEPEVLLGWTRSQRVRLFSIDGCHTAQHTASDLELASRVLSPGGIIALDDFDHAEWPTVREGAEAALSGPLRERLHPIVYGDNKLFLSDPESARGYQSALLEVVSQSSRPTALMVAGTPCPTVSAPSLESWLSTEDWHRVWGPECGRVRFAHDSSTQGCRLEQGWSEREPWGVWSDGDESHLLIPVGSNANTIEIAVTYHPFLAPGHPSLRIEAAADGNFLDSWTASSEGRQTQRLRIERAEAASPWLELRLKYDSPHSPADLGYEADRRRLAIGLEEIAWRPFHP